MNFFLNQFLLNAFFSMTSSFLTFYFLTLLEHFFPAFIFFAIYMTFLIFEELCRTERTRVTERANIHDLRGCDCCCDKCKEKGRELNKCCISYSYRFKLCGIFSY